jgi:hypothetical protein
MMVSTSVARLLLGLLSGVLLETLTELLTVPEAERATVAVAVNVAVPPTGRSTDEVLMFPVPDAGQLDPAEGTHVHETPVNEAGNASATLAPTTHVGPLFAATIW